MSTPTSPARYLRGALVGVCSALLTGAAHTAAGGDLPGSGPLVLLLAGCATLGALTATLTVAHRHAKAAVLVAALGAGQLLGHFALTLAGGHGGGHGLTALMLTAHVVAALALGVLIGLGEYLYLVARSMWCWLRLVLVSRVRPADRSRPAVPGCVVVQPVLLCAGLGMRAPPRRVFAGG